MAPGVPRVRIWARQMSAMRRKEPLPEAAGAMIVPIGLAQILSVLGPVTGSNSGGGPRVFEKWWWGCGIVFVFLWEFCLIG